MATTGARVGERLRAIRRQKGLSLHDVEARSSLEFKASVLGAYERGERAISVPRLLRLAEIYEVPADQLAAARFRRRDQPRRELRRVGRPGGHLRHRPRAPARRRRSRRADHLEVRVVDPARAPGLQRPHAHDPALRPAGPRVVHGPQPRRPRVCGSSSSACAPPREPPNRRRTTGFGLGFVALRLNPPWQRLERPARLRPPPSRSWSRATTSWWVCWVNATSCCA